MLNEFDILRKELKELLKSNDNRKSLYKWLKSELAYTSNAIEGNTLTLDGALLAQIGLEGAFFHDISDPGSVFKLV